MRSPRTRPGETRPTPRQSTVRVWLAACLTLALVAGACSYSAAQFQLDVPPSAESSRIYDRDGRLITVVHGGENREVVGLDQIGENLQNAVVAIEDERFWTHQGVDPQGIVRAARSNAASGRIAEGGSTLSQQLIKNLILDDEKSLERKLEEFSLSLQLERTWTKERILEAYLNTVFFCNNAGGVQAASQEYFEKDANELTNGEAALLAGMIQRPCDFDPFENLEGALERRSLVVGAMLRNGYLTDDEASDAEREEVELAEETPDVDEQHAAPHFVDEVREWFFANPAFGETQKDRENLFYEGGLEIHTTIDLDHQLEAEVAVNAELGKDPTTPRGALVSLEPGTGRVRAMVGGLNYYNEFDPENATPVNCDIESDRDDGGPFAGEANKVNLAVGLGRQAGSSFKPLVLTAALAQNLQTDTEFDAPGSLVLPPLTDTDRPWRVSNYSGGGSGRLDLVEATVKSSNTVYAQLIRALGVEPSLDMARRLGITSDLRPFESAVLGANEVTVIEMANAYATLAAEGQRTDPVIVERVIGADGAQVYAAETIADQAIDADVANRVTEILEQVVERGTGTNARLDKGRPAAGKTGTNQEWRDAWFVGYTPELATAVWVGFPECQVSMRPLTTPTTVNGGSAPAFIWSSFMNLALRDEPVRQFNDPAPVPERTTVDATVPRVVNLTTSQAVRRLESRGFRPGFREVLVDDRRAGLVVSQFPSPGSALPPDGLVTINVSARRSGFAPPEPPTDPGDGFDQVPGNGRGIGNAPEPNADFIEPGPNDAASGATAEPPPEVPTPEPPPNAPKPPGIDTGNNDTGNNGNGDPN